MRPTPRLLLAVMVLLAVAPPLLAQRRPLFGPTPDAPCQSCPPGTPGMPGAPAAPGSPGMSGDPNAPGQPQNQPQDSGDAGGRGAVLASGSASVPGFVGGFGQQSGGFGRIITTGFKLLEGDTLVPVDRIYMSFVYTNGMVQDSRTFGGSDVTANQFRQLYGIEKAFLDNRVSVTLRVPVSTLHSDDLPLRVFNGGTGTSTVVGDASLVFKAILFDNPERGNTFAAGLDVGIPTAQTFFIGNLGVLPERGDWVIQPYVGGIFRRGELTFQDATGFGFPTSADHAAYFYTSNSAAWMFYRADSPKRFVTSMSAIAELFVLEPLGPTRASIQVFEHTADFISVSLGNSVVLRDWVYWTYGVSTPITKHKSYSTQVVTSLSVRY